MFRSLAVAVLVSFFLLPSTDAQAQPHFDKTCRYFENRTFFGNGSDRSEWLSLLSESCAEALRRLSRDVQPDQAAEDRAYLERLAELRRVVIAMNVARFTEPQIARGRIKRTVTGSGEYLIAKRIGVMHAYHAWAEASGFDTAALPAQ